MENNEIPIIEPLDEESSKKLLTVPQILLASGLFFLLLFIFLISAPLDFPSGKIITIEEGATLKKIAADFKSKNIIRSANIFDSFVRYSGYEKKIKAGKYIFDKPLSIFGLAKRLINGDYGISSVKITIPEGSTIREINEIFGEKGFENFEIKSKELEGYLFPDTYFFALTATPQDAVAKMNENLKIKTADLEEEISKSGRAFHQILTMASLIEEEASKTDDRKIISGILWKRFDKKMLLQIDAAFIYAIGKNTYQLTAEDLKIDNPYNTYKYTGLPPTPISNPGLDAINAAVYPEKSPYWFYLSDKEGNTYYAKTFEEHKINKEKYLR